VACQSGTTCTFSCQGESYDVNNNPADGCEMTDPTTGNHTQGSATAAVDQSCQDGTLQTVSGHIVSDARTHAAPAVNGFDGLTGSAPDWYAFTATGGICVNDLSATFTTSGGGATNCYKLSFVFNSGTLTSTVISGNGSTTLAAGSGAYSDDTTVYVKVEKTCSTATRENVTYSVQFHL
jgi:hypothetical protein